MCTLSREKKRKFEATLEDLTRMIFKEKFSYVAIGKHYNVSDNAIKKRCRLLGIEIPKKKNYPKNNKQFEQNTISKNNSIEKNSDLSFDNHNNQSNESDNDNENDEIDQSNDGDENDEIDQSNDGSENDEIYQLNDGSENDESDESDGKSDDGLNNQKKISTMQKIRNLTKDEVDNLIKKSNSVTNMLKNIGIGSHTSSDYRLRIINKINEFGLTAPTPKFNSNRKFKKKPLSEILIDGPCPVSGPLLKKRLLEANLVDNRCKSCNIGPEWQNKQLTLQVDHINGHHCCNLLTNLQILCPNCHSQTSNYAGAKNKGKKKMKLMNDVSNIIP